MKKCALWYVLLVGLLAIPPYAIAQPVPEPVFGASLNEAFPPRAFVEYRGQVVALGNYFPALYSVDQGRTWLSGPAGFPQASDFPNSAPGNISFHARQMAQEDNRVMVVSQFRYVHLSLDGGATWTLINTGLANNLEFVRGQIINGNLFIQHAGNPGYSVSRDDGATWVPVQPLANAQLVSLTLHRDTLFASVQSNATGTRIYTSTNDAQTWVGAQTGMTLQQANGARLHSIGGRLFALSLNAAGQFEWNGSRWATTTFFPQLGGEVSQSAGSTWYRVGTSVWRFNDVTLAWDAQPDLYANQPNPYATSFSVAATYLHPEFRLISVATAISPSFAERSRVVRADVASGEVAVTYAPALPTNTQVPSYPSAHLIRGERAFVYLSPAERFQAGANGAWQLRLPALGGTTELVQHLAETSNGLLASTSTGRILLFNADFSGPPTVIQTGLSNSSVAARDEIAFVATGNPVSALRRSTDGGRTFTPLTGLPTGARMARPQFYDDGILAGNLFSTDDGATWTVAFPFNLNIVAAHRSGDRFLIATTRGLFTRVGEGQPILVNQGGIDGNSDIQHLVANDRLAVFAVGRTLYYTTNYGQTIERLTTLEPSVNVIRSVSLVGTDLYVSDNNGLRKWNLSSLGAGFFVETLAPANLVAVDSSRNGVRSTLRGRVDSPQQDVSVYFEWRVVGAATISGRTESRVISAAAASQDIEFDFTGLPANFYGQVRIVGEAEGITIRGEWQLMFTPSYNFWRDISPAECGTCRFYDGIETATGRIVLASSNGIYTSDNLTRTWEYREGSPGGIYSLVRTVGDTLIGGTTGGSFYHSVDDGATWALIPQTGLPSLGGDQTIVRMTYSPTHHVLLAIYGMRQPATNNAVRLVRSGNGGRVWTVISDSVGLMNRLPLALAADPAGNLYLGTNSQATPNDEPNDPILRRSTDGGMTWEALLIRDGTVTQLPQRSSVEDLSVLGNDVYASVTDGFYQSREGGASFERVRSPSTRHFVALGPNEFLGARGFRGSDSFFFQESLAHYRADGVTLSVASGYRIDRRRVNRFVRFRENTVLALSNDAVYCWMCDGEGSTVSVPGVEPVFPEEARGAGVWLGANFPNPMRHATSIPFALAEASTVRLEVFNLLGQRVAVVLDDVFHPAGIHSVSLQAEQWPAGMYVYVMRAGSKTATGRMTVVR